MNCHVSKHVYHKSEHGKVFTLRWPDHKTNDFLSTENRREKKNCQTVIDTIILFSYEVIELGVWLRRAK